MATRSTSKSLNSDLPSSGSETLFNLANAVYLHIRGNWGYRTQANLDRLIENKKDIVRLFKQLPEDIKKACSGEADGKPLYRGVSVDTLKEFGEWNNGKFVYGFTDSLNTARRFANGHTENGSRVLTFDDIDSYGGVIDLKKLSNVIKDYNKDKPLGDHIKDFGGFSDAYGETEYLVYDIKFKTRPDGKFYSDKPYEQGAWDNYERFNPLNA